MGVYASTPFIGPARNNFSHIFTRQVLDCLFLDGSLCPALFTCCLKVLQILSKSASVAVLFCFSDLSRFDALQVSGRVILCRVIQIRTLPPLAHWIKTQVLRCARMTVPRMGHPILWKLGPVHFRCDSTRRVGLLLEHFQCSCNAS